MFAYVVFDAPSEELNNGFKTINFIFKFLAISDP
jgi:hypothetical protein